MAAHSILGPQHVCRQRAGGRRLRQVVTRASGVVARWTVDCRFGCKLATLRLMSQWLSTVASPALAGLGNQRATRVLSVQIGGTEARCELELQFSSLSELEQFWTLVPQAGHAAWLQRLAPNVVDGSTHWTILTELPGEEGRAPADQAAEEPRLMRTASGLLIPQAEAVAAAVEEPLVELDWKGDPMTRNAGDKMPQIV
jgi:hypothetical protein